MMNFVDEMIKKGKEKTSKLCKHLRMSFQTDAVESGIFLRFN